MDYDAMQRPMNKVSGLKQMQTFFVVMFTNIVVGWR